MHIVHVIGARPNLMKVAPVQRALARRNVRQTLIHTGQHYDDAMFTALATELALPPIDINLEVGSGSHAAQTSRVMVSLEPQLIALRPDLVILYGDVNSTMAAAIVAAKLAIPMAHVEAGLRCGDRTMPEELNRLVTDRLSSFLFTPSEDADANLLHEGVVASSIHRVGNVMIDSLVRLLPSASAGDLLDRWGLGRKPDLTPFVFVTLHRPSNVDDPLALQTLLSQLTAIARTTPVVFAVHPRTRQRLGGLDQLTRDLVLTPPLTYLQCLDVQRHASVVVTDWAAFRRRPRSWAFHV